MVAPATHNASSKMSNPLTECAAKARKAAEKTAAAAEKKAATAKKKAAATAKKAATSKENSAPSGAAHPSASSAGATTQGGGSVAMQDVGNAVLEELAAVKAALMASKAQNEELQKKLGVDEDRDEPQTRNADKRKDLIPRPAGHGFNIQQAMGLAGSARKRETYKALVRHLHDLTMHSRLNWELEWARIPPKEKANLFDVARERHPFLARFVNDWATEEIVKQYIKNKRKYAFQKGYLDVNEKYDYLKVNASKRGSGSRRSRADIELEVDTRRQRRQGNAETAVAQKRAGKRKVRVASDDEEEADVDKGDDEEEDEEGKGGGEGEGLGKGDDDSSDDGMYA